MSGSGAMVTASIDVDRKTTRYTATKKVLQALAKVDFSEEAKDA